MSPVIGLQAYGRIQSTRDYHNTSEIESMMGQAESSSSSTFVPSSHQQQQPEDNINMMEHDHDVPTTQHTSSSSSSTAGRQQISSLINYARSNYQENPTESLAALMQALTLNSGKASADQALQRLRHELGDEIADHIGNHHLRMERAIDLVQQLLEDESTILYENGQQHLLKQTMEDGTSVVCTKCGAVVASNRWQQHQTYWCDYAPTNNNHDNDNDGDNDEMMDNGT